MPNARCFALVLTLTPLLSSSAWAGDPPTTDGCDMKVEGDVTATVGTGASGGFMSDYWLSKDQLRHALASLGKDAAAVEAAMKGDPVLQILVVNCGDEAVRVTFSPVNGSKYADVPLKARKYPLSNQASKPGDMLAVTMVKGSQLYMPTGGVLDITRFDKTGITGTFAFDAAPLDPKVKKSFKVTGKFHFKP